ncbi:hypothetical protein VC83_06498 [Pseudogymnoascus destructans]|uniref:Pyridine nucleotide-disulphide oxidoreductase dimerisation domain-containing protein n=1 Tax=Pseudogymnoascus destructans TaxID=655981 RepID=A0A177A8B3_9PEZI|nr:uncharacterized protein VC83_06498 [Pseudogymnoascus destructans]OAF58408.1 hypothetical protein VC83_06498 [Pseudogymnoascus destructans]
MESHEPGAREASGSHARGLQSRETRKICRSGDHLRSPEMGYAAGDCVADSPQFVYTAAAEGKLAALNALRTINNREPEKIDYSVVPWVVFTTPAVAGVGVSLIDARAKGIDAEASSSPLNLLPGALVQQSTQGFVTLVRDKSDDRIVGAFVLAEE